MLARLKSLLALSAAAAACACAQACASRDAGAHSAAATRAAAQSTVPSTQVALNETPSPTPAPYVAQYPALKRGDEAFEPYISLSGGRRVESRAVARKPKRKDMEVAADYPVLLGDASAAAREFNRRVRSFVVGDVTPYIEDTPDPEKQKDPFWRDVKEWHNVSHKVVFASDEIVSVLFYVEGYNWGAGHGFHRPVSFNFDMKAGREIRLADLFEPGSNHLERISRLCSEDLNRQFQRGQLFSGGTEPTPKNFGAWVVTPGGLVFVFEEYQLVAYAEGEPKVLIPFDRLRDIIRPQSALTKIIASE